MEQLYLIQILVASIIPIRITGMHYVDHWLKHVISIQIAPGKICTNGVCVDDPSQIACETSEQCPEGYSCTDGFCALIPD